mmetsp:Transcript_9983/g.15087  ORF Transcript_9983/g.15087 Transcript_9983/m.15087 type:complete len:281 (+) Transcript_9983:1693-2535(+)
MHLVLLHSLHHVMLATSQCLNDDVEDARPEQRHVDAYSLQVLAEGRETPLEAEVILFTVLVLYEVIILLIDRVVGQMHELIVLIELCSVGLGGKPCQPLLIYVDPQGLVASHHHVDTQVELVPVDQQGVRDVPRDDAQLVNVQVIDVVDYVDATASTRVAGLHDPNIAARVRLLQFLVVTKEVSVLIRQDVGIRHKIEGVPPELLLHLDVVEAEAVLASNLVGVREVVDALELVEALIQVGFAAAARPQEIPLVALSEAKSVGFADATHQLRITLQNLVQ